MEEVAYLKLINGVAFEVAHVYEHAFILACQDELATKGLPPYLVASLSGETFYKTFMYVTADVFDSATANYLRDLFTSNLQPSEAHLQHALIQTACEDMAVATIKNKAVYEKQMKEISSRKWVRATKQPLSAEGIKTSSPVLYRVNKQLYKRCLIEINFGSVRPIEAALLNRLVYLVTDSIGQSLRRSFYAFTATTQLLDYYQGGMATLGHTVIISAAVEKSAIEHAVRESLKPFLDKENDRFVIRHFENWSKNKWNQLATLGYYKKTGLLVGSEVLAHEILKQDLTHIIERATIRISLRKI